jgi:phage gp46-like protein
MDVALYNTVEGGEITCEGGQIALDEGVATAVYISLWGANEDDAGDDSTKPREWWANKIETSDVKKLRSRVQNLLRSMPLTSGNLQLLEEAAAQDLQWMLDTKLVDAVVPRASIPAINTLKLEVKIEIQNRAYTPLAFIAKAGSS